MLGRNRWEKEYETRRPTKRERVLGYIGTMSRELQSVPGSIRDEARVLQGYVS